MSNKKLILTDSQKEVLKLNNWAFGKDENGVFFAKKDEREIYGSVVNDFLEEEAEELLSSSYLDCLTFNQVLKARDYKLISLDPLVVSDVKSGKEVKGLMAEYVIMTAVKKFGK